MINEPRVVIKYVESVPIQLDTANTTYDSDLSDYSNLFSEGEPAGKRWLQLAGGSYDEETGEDIGTLINGRYTVFDDTLKYDGLVGSELSNSDYEFDNDQYFTITSQNGEYIKNIFVYFDKTAEEYATEILIDNVFAIHNNNKYVVVCNFGEDSTRTSVRVDILKWSKKNSQFKIVKVAVGYTGVYGTKQIRDIYYTRDKIADAEELQFGVSIQEATLEINDYDDIIQSLYDTNLFPDYAPVEIYIDSELQGSFVIDKKSTENELGYWTFDCIDYVGLRLQDTINPLNVEYADSQIVAKSVKSIIEYIIGDVVPIVYSSAELKEQLNHTMVDVPFLNAQTREEALKKCCQLKLLRMYTSEDACLIVARGV